MPFMAAPSSGVRPLDDFALGARGDDHGKVGGVGGGHHQDLGDGPGEPGAAEVGTEPVAEFRLDRCQAGLVEQAGLSLPGREFEVTLKCHDHARWRFHGGHRRLAGPPPEVRRRPERPPGQGR